MTRHSIFLTVFIYNELVEIYKYESLVNKVAAYLRDL